MRVFLKPVKGKKVRKPDTPYKAFLKEEGEHVVLTTYWRRRLNDKSVEQVAPAPAATKPLEKAAKKQHSTKEKNVDKDFAIGASSTKKK